MTKSVIDVALENIDTKIAALQHARDLIVEASASAPTAEAPKKRGRKPKKMGLPQSDTGE